MQIDVWSSYIIALWLLKGAMCTFYFRLMRDLEGYRTRIHICLNFISISSLVAQLNCFISCRPRHHMWQISPNPGRFCQPAVSPALIWTTFSLSVATHLCLILIPMSVLFKAAMPLGQRLRLFALFSCELLVLIAAVLRARVLASVSIARA